MNGINPGINGSFQDFFYIQITFCGRGGPNANSLIGIPCMQRFLISLGKNAEAEKIYKDLEKNNIEVLYDDREDTSAGAKFADADLIGIPWRIVVSEKSFASGGVEVKKRSKKEREIVKIEKLIEKIK